MSNNTKPQIGSRVLVSKDCRGDDKATGKYGIYEGDFPRTVALGSTNSLNKRTLWAGECSYSAYASGAIKTSQGTPVKERFPEWIQGQPQPMPRFAMVITNPRIRLDDGSEIWGDECWWGVAVDGVEPQEALEQTEAFAKFVSDLAKVIEATEAAEREK